MPSNLDYRLYLDEKFQHLTTLMNAQFRSQNETLEEIQTHVEITNGRVTHLEEFKEYAQRVIDMRATDCPNVQTMIKTKDDVAAIKQDLEGMSLKDLSFVMRHPKLFVGAMVVLVILAFLTFIDSLPFNLF